MAMDYGRAATLTLGDGMIQTPCLNHATTQYPAAVVAHLIKHATRTRRDKLKLPMSTRLYESEATMLNQLVKSSCLDAVVLLCGHRDDPLSACCCEHKITSRLWMNLAVLISREDIYHGRPPASLGEFADIVVALRAPTAAKTPRSSMADDSAKRLFLFLK